MGTCKDQQGQIGPWNERPLQDHGDEGNLLRAIPLNSNERKEMEGNLLRAIPLNSNERKEMEVVGKRRFGPIKPMLSTFPNTIQTHLLQISLQGRNMMLCHLDC